MAITKKQIEELLKDMAEGDDVTETLQGIEGISQTVEVPFDVNNLTIDDYKAILETNKAIQGYNQSQIDSFVSRGVETFKTGKMQEYIDEAIKKATIPPDETPEQKSIRELQEKLAEMEKKEQEANKALAKTQLAKETRGYLKEQYKDFNFDIPDTILERCLSEDFDSTKGVVDGLVGFVTETLKADRASYYNTNNPQPPTNEPSNTPKKMSLTEAMQYANEHPEVDVKTLI